LVATPPGESEATLHAAIVESSKKQRYLLRTLKIAMLKSSNESWTIANRARVGCHAMGMSGGNSRLGSFGQCQSSWQPWFGRGGRLMSWFFYAVDRVKPCSG